MSTTLWSTLDECKGVLRQMLNIIDDAEKKDIVKHSNVYFDYGYGPITYKSAHTTANFHTMPTEIVSKIFKMAVCEEDWYADVSGRVI